MFEKVSWKCYEQQQYTDPDACDNSPDENVPLCRSNSINILPSQIENIIKAKPVFVKKIMPSMQAQVPNFSTNMKQKLQEFQQAFSQEIPTVEQASNFTFKKPAGVPKKKSGIGMLRCLDVWKKVMGTIWIHWYFEIFCRFNSTPVNHFFTKIVLDSEWDSN